MWWKLRPVQRDRYLVPALWVMAGVAAWQLLYMVFPLIGLVGAICTRDAWADVYAVVHPLYVGVLGRSTLLAMVTTAGCFILAFPLAYFLVFAAGRFRVPGVFLIVVPFGINFLLHMYGWFFVLDRQGLVNTFLLWLGVTSAPVVFLHGLGAVILMMVYYYMPFMLLSLYSQMDKIDPRLFQASADLGATWWQTVRLVLVPLSFPGIALGSFLVFVPAFGEFAIPEMMGGDRIAWVGSVVAHLILGPETVRAGIVFTLICSIWLGFLVVVSMMGRKILRYVMGRERS